MEEIGLLPSIERMEIEEEGEGGRRKRINKQPKYYRKGYVIGWAMVAAIAGIIYGFTLVTNEVIYPFIATIYHFEGYINDNIGYFTCLSGTILYLGATLGAIFAGINGRLGRRTLLLVANGIFCASFIFRLISTYYCLVIASFIAGFACGILLNTTPLFIREITPVEIRGRMGILTEIGIVLGITLAGSFGAILPNTWERLPPDYPDSYEWRLIISIPLVFSVFQVILLLFVYRSETPKYLYQQSEFQKCEQVLSFIYFRMERIKEELRQLETVGRSGYVKDEATWKELWSIKFRKALLIGCLMATLRECVGINFLNDYASFIFSESNAISFRTAMTIMNIIHFCGSIPSFLLIDWWGRKKPMIIGSTGIAVCLITVGLIGVSEVTDVPLKGVLFSLYMIFFGVSYGPIMWVYMSEILPDKGFTFAMIIYWIWHIINLWISQIIVTYTLDLYIACFVYFTLSLLGIFYSIFGLRESMGLNEIDLLHLYLPHGVVIETKGDSLIDGFLSVTTEDIISDYSVRMASPRQTQIRSTTHFLANNIINQLINGYEDPFMVTRKLIIAIQQYYQSYYFFYIWVSNID